MRNLMSAGLVLFLSLVLCACGGGDWSTPQDTMKKAKAAFDSGDMDKIVECYHPGDHVEKMKKEIKEINDSGMKLSISYKEEDIKIEGEKASVKVEMKFTDKDGKEDTDGETFHMSKKDGIWKLDGR